MSSSDENTEDRLKAKLQRTATGDPSANERFRQAGDDIIRWCEDLTTIDGDPMDYSGGFRFWKEPMRAVVDPETPEEHLWCIARGVGKTEQSARVKWYFGTTQRMRDCIYSTPRMRQIRTFQKTIVRRMVDGSRGDPPILKALLDTSDVHVQRNDLRSPPNGPGPCWKPGPHGTTGTRYRGITATSESLTRHNSGPARRLKT